MLQLKAKYLLKKLKDLGFFGVNFLSRLTTGKRHCLTNAIDFIINILNELFVDFHQPFSIFFSLICLDVSWRETRFTEMSCWELKQNPLKLFWLLYWNLKPKTSQFYFQFKKLFVFFSGFYWFMHLRISLISHLYHSNLENFYHIFSSLTFCFLHY